MSILLTLGQLALFTPGGCPKAKLELDDARPKTQLRDAKQFRPPPSTAIPLKFTCDSVACAATNPLGALAYQHIARAMLHQLTLLFGRFAPHEAHGRSPNRELARIGQLVPDDFYSRSSVGETGVDHFVGAREQRGRHGEPTS